MPSAHKAVLTPLQKCVLAILRFLCRLLALSGYGGLYRLGRMGGFLMWFFLPSRRKQAVQAIMERLGKTRSDAAGIAKESFCSNVQSFLEIVQAPHFKLPDNPRLSYSDGFIRMNMESRPVVATLGHIGAWELLAGIMADFRPEYPRLIVVRNQKSAVMNELIRGLRSVGEAQAVGHRNVSADVMAALRQKGTVAFLVDHNTQRREAVFLPFLGKMASVNFGPALLALRAKAMVYPLFLVRTARDSYKIINFPPLDTAELKGGIQERALLVAQFYNSAAEEMVREYPEQWLWMHKRWKTRPKPGDLGCSA